jgi:hypothetical protein
MVMEIATCGQYSPGIMKPGPFFKFGNDFQSTLASPRKPKILRTHSFDEWNRISKIGLKFGNDFQSTLASSRKPKILRTHYFDEWNRISKISLRRSCRACFNRNNNNNNYNDSSVEEYRNNLQESALQSYSVDEDLEVVKTELGVVRGSVFKRKVNESYLGFGMWEICNSISNYSISWPATLGNKGSDVVFPLSLQVLLRKLNKVKEKKITGNSKEAKKPACCQCSVRRASSSMVFMMWEFQAHTLQIREILLHENLHELLVLVQREMQSSLVWLFQQVLSCTPSLMVSIMILLANFTVYSMRNNVAVAATLAVGSTTSNKETQDVKEVGTNKETQALRKFKEENPSWIKLSNQFSPPVLVNIDMPNSLCYGLSGGARRNLATGADGYSHDYEGNSHENHIMIMRDNLITSYVSSLQNPVSGKEGMAGTSGSDVEEAEKENENPADQMARDILLWQSFLKEFESNSMGDIGLDPGTMKSLVAQVTAQLEPDNYICYDRTELLYQNAIRTDPDNALLLSNYARFLHLVRHDHDRFFSCYPSFPQAYLISVFACHFLFFLFYIHDVYTDCVEFVYRIFLHFAFVI